MILTRIPAPMWKSKTASLKPQVPILHPTYFILIHTLILSLKYCFHRLYTERELFALPLSRTRIHLIKEDLDSTVAYGSDEKFYLKI